MCATSQVPFTFTCRTLPCLTHEWGLRLSKTTQRQEHTGRMKQTQMTLRHSRRSLLPPPLDVHHAGWHGSQLELEVVVQLKVLWEALYQPVGRLPVQVRPQRRRGRLHPLPHRLLKAAGALAPPVVAAIDDAGHRLLAGLHVRCADVAGPDLQTVQQVGRRRCFQARPHSAWLAAQLSGCARRACVTGSTQSLGTGSVLRTCSTAGVSTCTGR